MSSLERWTAVGAVGAVMAGIAAVAPLIFRAVQTIWAWLPTVSLDFWHLISAIGLVIGAVGALVAIWLALRARRAGPADYDALSGSASKQNNHALRIALLVLAITVAAGASFLFTGGVGSVTTTLKDAAKGESPSVLQRDTTGDSLATVCANARNKFSTRSQRPALPAPAGNWTGWTTWTQDDEQQWTLDSQGQVRLTAGHPGTWRLADGGLTLTFEHTIFKARIYGELMCGVRIHPGRSPSPDGNFQLVFLAAPEPENGSAP
jgi:hypothetical protein